MPGQLPDPPETTDIAPEDMTAAQLRETAERLWSWLERAQSIRDVTDADEREIDRITEALNDVTRERRRRHSEEFPMRGS